MAAFRNFILSKALIRITAVLCFLGLINEALAWGPGGHMIVARIAYSRLNPRAKAEADRLLAIPIDPVAITQKSLDFVNASHWPDDLRPEKAFADTLPLHFVDFPFSTDNTQLPADLPEDRNILTALTKYVDILKTSKDDQARAQALRFIIHFVGDIHQPLHCATRVTQNFPEGDRGGNDFVIALHGGNGNLRNVKLHSYWDGGIGDFPPSAPPNYTPPPLAQVNAAVARITREFPDTDDGWKAAGPFGFAEWASESKQLAESVAYAHITANSQPTDAYNEAALKTVHQRVAWGGYRLADLLNTIWPDSEEKPQNTATHIQDSPEKAGPEEIYPDSLRTPGAPNPDITQDNISDNICSKSWSTSSVRPSTSITSRIKRDTMKAYGLTDSPGHYELDHLISLQVGGCPDCVENLWPQAYGDKGHPLTQNQRAAFNRENTGSEEIRAGSLEKDLVENHIHDEICFGIPDAKMSSLRKKFPATISITLKRGQEILATDWYACYLNMIHDNKPCE